MASEQFFFDERSEQSEIKTEIVSKFFAAWANVLINAMKNKGLNQGQIGYVDLWAGPGRYKDQSPSTPLRVLEHATRTPEIAAALVAEFNDGNPKFASSLETEIERLPNIKFLSHRPIVGNTEITGSSEAKLTVSGGRRPTLYFFDPWGYKGLTLTLIKRAVTPFGCDCIFFFNIKRVRAAIDNPLFETHMNAMFGLAVTTTLRQELKGNSPEKARSLIVRALESAVRGVGGQFVNPFRIFDDYGNLSHLIILTSKSRKAYEIMKNIMAKLSSHDVGGIPAQSFNPAKKGQGSLFANFGVERLEDELLRVFAGKTLRFSALYALHNVGTNYLERHYREAVNLLEEAGKITVAPSMQQRIKGGKITCGPNVEITFPILGGN